MSLGEKLPSGDYISAQIGVAAAFNADKDAFRSFALNLENPEVENLQLARERREEIIEARQKEKSGDTADQLMEQTDDALERMEEERLRIRYDGTHFHYGDYEFELEDLKDAVRDNLDNWDEFSKDMSEPEQEEYLALSIMLLSTDDPEEVQRIIDRMGEISQDATTGTAQRAEQRFLKKNTIENEATAQLTDEQDLENDDFFADMLDDDFGAEPKQTKISFSEQPQGPVVQTPSLD